jgi:hypothetical protein
MPLTRRHYVLVTVLALGFVAMVWFIAQDSPIAPSEMALYGLFGALMVTLAVLTLRRNVSDSPTGVSLPRWLKCVFGAYALTFVT